MINRRGLFLLMGSSVVAPLLGCDLHEDPSDLSNWAGRLGSPDYFRSSVAWVEPNDIGGRTVAMAFLPFAMDTGQRHAVVANGGVFPVIGTKAGMLEVRFAMARGDADTRMGMKTLREVNLVFWNYAEPTPVVSLKGDDWTPSPELAIDRWDGNFTPGGWLDGSVRGRAIVKDEPRREEYLWNLQVTMSLE